uniref:B-cell lymphoma/leukemia 10 n=2 Tax=Petromyzon marinus TaxID=7757 RepID=A0AAJ7TBH5_PETMA|nr:B-cell lymphoma/leukemia 10 [Petromyzon marinus]
MTGAAFPLGYMDAVGETVMTTRDNNNGSSSSKTTMPLGEEVEQDIKREVLTNLLDYLSERIQADRHFAFLRARKVLSRSDTEEISYQSTRRRQAERLIEFLELHPFGLDGLLSSLQHEGTQKHIVDRLNNEWKRLRLTRTAQNPANALDRSFSSPSCFRTVHPESEQSDTSLGSSCSGSSSYHHSLSVPDNLTGLSQDALRRSPQCVVKSPQQQHLHDCDKHFTHSTQFSFQISNTTSRPGGALDQPSYYSNPHMHTTSTHGRSSPTAESMALVQPLKSPNADMLHRIQPGFQSIVGAESPQLPSSSIGPSGPNNDCMPHSLSSQSVPLREFQKMNLRTSPEIRKPVESDEFGMIYQPKNVALNAASTDSCGKKSPPSTTTGIGSYMSIFKVWPVGCEPDHLPRPAEEGGPPLPKEDKSDEV